MKTAEKDAKQGANAATNNNAFRIDNRPNIPGKDKNNETNDQQSAQVPEAEAGKALQAADISATAAAHQPADTPQTTAEAAVNQPGEPQSEVSQGGINSIKPALNLEQTLKTVGNLHRLTIQRLALIARIKTLEEFEVKLIEENDQLESNPYQGCKLTIKDDRGREFTTNTPNLIRMVTQYIFDACHDKLAEIEAHIVFPA